LAHAAAERFVLFGGAVGGGKTAWLVNEAIRLSMKWPGNAGYLCRHELQSFKRTTLEELLKFLPPELIAKHHQTDHFIRFTNGSTIWYGGLGDDREGIDRIKNMNLGWFGIDQAEETTEGHFTMLATRLRLVLPGIHYRGLLTANPAPGWVKERFIQSHHDNHVFIPSFIRDNKYLPSDYEQQLRDSGLPAELISQWVEGNWDVASGANELIPYQYIRAAINREIIGQDGATVIGVDVARLGSDESVAIVRRGDLVLDIQSWGRQDTVFSTGRVNALVEQYRPNLVAVDEIGVGVGVLDPLRAAGVRVRGINVAGKALDDIHFANLRAEMYQALAKRFEQGRISIPDHQRLCADLSVLAYKFDNHQRLLIEAKEDLRRRLGRSTDYADALMLSFVNAQWIQEPDLWARRQPTSYLVRR